MGSSRTAKVLATVVVVGVALLAVTAMVLGTFVLGVGQDQQTAAGYSAGGAQDANDFRNNVENGYLPQEDAVTYEGLYREYYFDRGQDRPCEELLCPSGSTAVSRDPLSNETEYYATVGLTAGFEEFERPDLNLVIVVDTSGSMESELAEYYYDGESRSEGGVSKMTTARRAVAALTENLRDDDRVGVVAYDDSARTVVEMGRVGDRDMDRVRARVRGMSAGGGTNLADGMDVATRMAEPYTDGDDRETRVIYVTDAMPNLGDTSGEGLGGRLQSNAERGIHATFVGVGVDFNSRLVETISEVRGANYYTVRSAEGFRERMDEGFRYMVTPLVYDLTVTVESESFEVRRVYGSPSADDGRAGVVRIETLFPSQSEGNRTRGGVVLVELRRTGPGDRATLVANYEDAEGTEHTTTRSVTFREGNRTYYDHDGVRKAIVLARYADLLKNWIEYERASLSGADPGVGTGIADPGEYEHSLGQWEQRSVELRVSPEFRQRIRRFLQYFRAEAAAIGDEELSTELAILERILAAPGPTTGERESGSLTPARAAWIACQPGGSARGSDVR